MMEIHFTNWQLDETASALVSNNQLDPFASRASFFLRSLFPKTRD